MDKVVVEKLKERYSSLHPLIVHRTIERAKNLGELFDILEEVPDDFPLIWKEESRRWVVVNDLTLAK